MIVTAAHITPLVAIIAGILILINNVHHFINWH
jgi:hypothetical protein